MFKNQGNSYGSNNTQYTTEINSYSKIVAYGNQNTPYFFKVYTKGNQILTYGFETTRQFDVYKSTQKKWPLTKIEDYFGNVITYSYIIEPNFVYLDNVQYANKKISFSYETRIDVQTRYFDSSLLEQIKKRMNRITISAKDTNSSVGSAFSDLKYINIYYTNDKTSQSLINSIQMCFTSTQRCLRPLNFNYDQKVISQLDSQTISKSVSICGSATSTDKCKQTQLVDVDGDGISDLVSFGNDGVYVTLNTYKGWMYKKAGGANTLTLTNTYNIQKWSSDFCSSSGWDKDVYSIFLADVNGDRLPDLIGFKNDGVFVALNNNGLGFLSMQKWLSSFNIDPNSFDQKRDLRTLIDVNNDGYSDLLSYSSNGVEISYNNKGTGFSASFKVSSSLSSKLSTNYFLVPGFADMNADSFVDFTYLMSKGDSSLSQSYTAYMTNIKSQTTQSISINSDLMSNDWDRTKNLRQFMDLNRDGLPDLVGVKSNTLFVSYGSLNNNGVIQYVSTSKYTFGTENLDEKYVTFTDIDGDGFADAVAFLCDGVYVMRFNGLNDFIGSTLWTSDVKSCSSKLTTTYQRYVLDVNGDGIQDIVSIDDSNIKISYGKSSNRIMLSSLTDSLDNGLRITYTSLIENNVRNSVDESEKLSQLTSSFWTQSSYTMFGSGSKVVVKQVDRSMSMKYNGFDKDVLSTYYAYGNLKCSVTVGLGACRYAWIEMNENGTPTRRRSEFNQIHPFSLGTKSDKSFYNDILIENKINNHSIITTKYGSINTYAFQLAGQTKFFYDDANGKLLYSKQSWINYDEYSNIINSFEFTYGKSGEIVLSRNESYVIKNNESTWNLNQVVEFNEIVMLRNDPKSVKRKQIRQIYNNKTRVVVEKVYLPDNAFLGLRETYMIDKFGNQVQKSNIPINQSKRGNQIRTEKYSYDQYGLNIISRSNALGHTVTSKYDLDDNEIYSINSNNQRKENTYDELGRLVKEVKENGERNVYTYQWYSSLRSYVQQQSRSVISVFNTTKIEADGKQETKVLDSSKRVIRIVTKGYNGENINEDLTYYIPNLNQFQLNSLKYKENIEKPIYVTKQYDYLSREIARTEPAYDPYYVSKPALTGMAYQYYRIDRNYDGINVNYSYGRLETRDELGNMIQVDEPHSSSARYAYDAENNLIKVIDQKGSVTTFDFDLNKNRVSFNETNIGNTVYEYNAYNELMYEKELRSGNEITYERDLLGRVIKRTEKERLTQLVYDAAVNGVGFVSKISIFYTNKSNLLNHSTEFFYDKYSRVVQKLINTTSSVEKSSELIKYVYDDTTNQLIRTDYSDNVNIWYCYNSLGFLASMSLNSATNPCNDASSPFIWKAIGYRADGKLETEIFGNNIVQNYGYDMTTLLRRIELYRNVDNYQTVPGAYIRKLEYNYDYKRNLKERFYYFDSSTKLNSSEIFGYDLLDRLVSSNKMNARGTKLLNDSITSYSYDSMGNIIQVSSRNSTGYIQSSNNYLYKMDKPQQMASVNDDQITYDQNGNVIHTNAYDIQWYTFQKAKKISTNGNAISFYYNNENQRFLRWTQGAVAATSKDFELNYYVDDTLEKHMIYKNNKPSMQIKKFNIRIGAHLIATHVVQKNLTQSSISQATYYMHNDVTHSPDTITDQNGNILMKFKYEAFGQRVVLYSNVSNSYLELLNRGYTGHEYIDQGRLINMNGRIFDSLYLRFLSPDLVQNYFKTQGLNRYSYCLNNPFKYEDPSGFFSLGKFFRSVFKVAAIIAIGVITAGAGSYLAASLFGNVGFGAAVFSGAFASAFSGFATTLVTTGNLNLAFKNGLKGFVTGGVTGGINNLYPGEMSLFMKLGSEVVKNGVENRLKHKDFFDGVGTVIAVFAVTTTAEKVYSSVTEGEKASYKTGDEYVGKDYTTMPKAANMNVGTQGNPLDPSKIVDPKSFASNYWCGHEGCGLMKTLNNVPGKHLILLIKIRRRNFNINGHF